MKRTGRSVAAVRRYSSSASSNSGNCTRFIGGSSDLAKRASLVRHEVALALPGGDLHAVLGPLRALGFLEPLAHMRAERGLDHLVAGALFDRFLERDGHHLDAV